MNFDSIFLKFGKLTSNYITKLFTYARHNYEIFENFGAMLISNILVWIERHILKQNSAMSFNCLANFYGTYDLAFSFLRLTGL